jgi:DNA methyltransferase 1-associated protein 1
MDGEGASMVRAKTTIACPNTLILILIVAGCRVWKGFQNPARGDDLTLYHWERKNDAANVTGETSDEQLLYQFAKFDVKVEIPEYSKGEYEVLGSEDFSSEETDYLFSLCREFDLRWPIIWDRYEWPDKARSLVDLKARYYGVCRSLMELRTPMNQMSPEETMMFNLLNFDKEREAARRAMAEKQFNKTQEQIKEEEMLLTELKRIVANQDKMTEERKDLINRLDFPSTSGSIAPYLGSQGLAHLRDMMLSSSEKNKKRKSIAMGSVNSGDTSAQTPTSANSTDRGGSGVSSARDREHKETKKQIRKLTAEEEANYGVSYLEKSTSGVKLRSVMPVSTVKGATAMKVSQALTQLGIAPRLTLPTAKTVAKYDQLQATVGTLLDSRKVLEKLEQEVRVTRAQLELKQQGA